MKTAVNPEIEGVLEVLTGYKPLYQVRTHLGTDAQDPAESGNALTDPADWETTNETFEQLRSIFTQEQADLLFVSVCFKYAGGRSG